MSGNAHWGFVIASYAVSGVVLLGLIAATIIDLRRQKKRVADLEAAGGRRRAPEGKSA